MMYEIIEINLPESANLLVTGEPCTLHCYVPDFKGKADGKSVIICPGGGYGFCSPREAEPIALKYLQAGIAAFVLYYSIAPNRFPSQVFQVAQTVKYIKTNAARLGLNADGIFISGFSAGGHLAGHYAVLSAENYFVPFLGGNANDYTVSGCILAYPVISAEFSHKGSFENLSGESFNTKSMRKYSIEKLITPNCPKMFIWHTFEDNVVSVMNSIVLAEQLTKNNISVELHIYQRGVHGLSLCNDITNPLNPGEIVENFSPRTKDWIINAIEWVKEN